MGNHDLQLINALKTGLFTDGLDVFSNLNDPQKSVYLKLLESLHYYFILDHFIVVHAGMNFTLANPFLGKEEMLNIRDFYYDSSKAQSKTIVHGHNPQTLEVILECIENKNKILPLDNGCVYAGLRDGMGKLMCLELNTLQLTWQEYCD